VESPLRAEDLEEEHQHLAEEHPEKEHPDKEHPEMEQGKELRQQRVGGIRWLLELSNVIVVDQKVVGLYLDLKDRMG
jgi:hypothetical protein